MRPDLFVQNIVIKPINNFTSHLYYITDAIYLPAPDVAHFQIFESNAVLESESMETFALVNSTEVLGNRCKVCRFSSNI